MPPILEGNPIPAFIPVTSSGPVPKPFKHLIIHSGKYLLGYKWFEVIAPSSNLRIETKNECFLTHSSHLPNFPFEVVRMLLLRLFTGADDRLVTPFILVVSLSHRELAKVNT